MRAWLAGVGLLLSGCLELALPPPPPPPGPGTLQGRLVHHVPGEQTARASRGARISLIDSSLATTADDEGRFVLGPLVVDRGLVRFAIDLDGDGVFDRQRSMTLESVGAGPGRDTALGDIVLGKNARVTGRVLRKDVEGSSNHFGTTVFASGTEFSATSADNGAFALGELPAGPLTITFFRTDYLSDVHELVLEAGEERRLTDVSLVPRASEPATATGLVVSPTGPLEGAVVRAVSSQGATSASTNVDGRFSLGPLTAGVWLIGVEKQGFSSAALGLRLLAPGTHELGRILLTAGTSTPLSLDAGAPPVPSDAGAGGGGAGGGAAGGTAGGMADAGQLDCAGACSNGRSCTSGVECSTTACGLTSCPGACNDGRCYLSSCAVQTCGVGEVCDGATCRPLACAGVTCPMGAQCAAGRCLPQVCRFGTCRPGTVCVNSTCLDTRCVDIDCGSQAVCVGGTCLAITSQSGAPCAPGFVRLAGRCVDLACEGLTCPAGSLCRTGQCTSSGLFVAGITYAEGRTNLTAETVIATFGPAGWKRLNVTALPPVIQLSTSPSGQWLYALTDDVPGDPPEGSLWRSADGVGWTKVFDGSSIAGGALASIAWDFETNTLWASINGGPSSTLNGSIASTNDGATWSRRITTLNGDRVTSVSPVLTAVPYSNNSYCGLYPNDGGTKLPYCTPVTARLFVDPAGVGPMIVGAQELRLVSDGGVIAPIAVASQDSLLYGPGTSLYATSVSSVWFSLDNGASWGLRPLPTTPTVSLVGLTRGADDALIIGNKNAQPPLFSSNDEGLTWNQLGTDWYAVPELSDPVTPWQPDASYGFQQRVRPRTPNGWLFERIAGPNISGRVEPSWSTDGGDVLEANGILWHPSGPHLGMRVTAITSLRCSSGQMRCGTACVDIRSSSSDCGACGRTCAGTCRNGTCDVSDSGVSQPGCADGTREGFIDEVQWPDMAACKGRWTGDLSSNADALCGLGFHVCTEADTELSTVRTSDALAFPGCFAYRASNDGFDGCEPLECQSNPNRDDMAGMGRGCLLVSGVTHLPSTIPDGGASCLADRGRIDAQCCAISVMPPGTTRTTGCRQRGEDGVVCCRN